MTGRNSRSAGHLTGRLPEVCPPLLLRIYPIPSKHSFRYTWQVLTSRFSVLVTPKPHSICPHSPTFRGFMLPIYQSALISRFPINQQWSTASKRQPRGETKTLWLGLVFNHVLKRNGALVHNEARARDFDEILWVDSTRYHINIPTCSICCFEWMKLPMGWAEVFLER